MGASDSLEIFSIYGQADSSSLEQSRILLQFPVDKITIDRTNGEIPNSGSVQFRLRLFNAKHPNTVPSNFRLDVHPIDATGFEWDEGVGIDMEGYEDKGAANWISASVGNIWTVTGSDFFHAVCTSSQTFKTGLEDLNMDVTPLVEKWINGDISNRGIVVKLTGSLETGSVSYYTKKFFSRSSEFFYKRPVIEALFDKSIKDDKTTFFISSSLAPSSDNLNTLFLYNRIRGRLQNIPGVDSGSIYLSLYSGSSKPTGSALILHNNTSSVTGGFHSVGIYSASVAITASNNLTHVYPVWHNNLGLSYYTGSEVLLKNFEQKDNFELPRYTITCPNLRNTYDANETARFNFFVRDKTNFKPNVYSIAVAEPENTIIEDAYFRIIRIIDNFEVIPFGTGNIEFTKLSFDEKGNYMDFDCSLLEPGYSYGLQLCFQEFGEFRPQPQFFKFRIEKVEK